MVLPYSGHIFFKEYSNVKFNGKPSSGSRVAAYGRKSDRHDEDDSRTLQFCGNFSLKCFIETCLVFCLTERRNFSTADCIVVFRDQ